MNLFQSDDYRIYLRSYVKNQPNKGRGVLARISRHLNVNTTLVSQVMGRSRDFTLEQGYYLSRYLGLDETETEYFCLLIQIERAGNVELKSHLQRRALAIKAEALRISKRVRFEKELLEKDRTVFYSSWLYSAVHLFTSISDRGVTSDEVAQRFHLSKARVNTVIQALVKMGLCTEVHGRFKIAIESTFINDKATDVARHHTNWRLRAIEKTDKLSASELMYSGQASLSKEDFQLLREKLVDFIKVAGQKIKDSKPQDIACLNIDWFWLD